MLWKFIEFLKDKEIRRYIFYAGLLAVSIILIIPELMYLNINIIGYGAFSLLVFYVWGIIVYLLGKSYFNKNIILLATSIILYGLFYSLILCLNNFISTRIPENIIEFLYIIIFIFGIVIIDSFISMKNNLK